MMSPNVCSLERRERSLTSQVLAWCAMILVVAIAQTSCKNVDGRDSSSHSVVLAEAEFETHPTGSHKNSIVVHIYAHDIKGSPSSLLANETIKIEDIYSGVSNVYYKLKRPIIVKIVNYLPLLKYPMKYTHKSVNNYVYEEIITKDNTEQYTGCDPESLCTSNMHRNLVLKGFCCFCEDTKQLINSKYHIRGGQDCSVVDVPDYITNKSMYHASTHCLKSDNLWYQVYSIDLPVVEHKALVNIDTMNANIDLNGVVDVKDVLTTILIGTASKMHNNEVVISYSSNFDHVLDNPFADKYILAADPHYPVENGDPQTKLGAYEYLVVDKSHITFNGSECNKVGVSYPAFMNKDNACGERLMSCLDNQPYHLWFYDTNKVVQNKKGKYFAGFYGHLVEVESDWQHLVYTCTKNYSYTLRLELEVKKTHDLNIRQGENQVSFEEVSNHHGNKDSEKKNVKNRVHVTMLDEILVYDDKEKETSQDNTNQLSDATKQFINGFVIILKENLTGFNYKAEVYWCLVGGGIISMLVLLLVVKHRRRKSEKVQVPVQNMSEKEHIIGKMENNSKTFDHIEDVFSDEEVQPAAKNSRKSSRKSKRKSKSETDVKPIIVPNATKMSTESNSSTSYNITAKNNKTRGRVRTSGTPRILPVYINLHGPDDILQNSGKEFSLCGVVIRTKSKKTPYRFEIGENTVQIFEIIKGEKKRRSKVFIIDPKHFTKLLTKMEYEELVSVTPHYLCLNSE